MAPPIEDASARDRPIWCPLPHLPCGRCHAVIEYSRGAEWSIVNELANEHWKVCPGKPHARLVHMAPTPNYPPSTGIALLPRVASEHRNDSNPIAGSAGPAGNPWISSGCERKRRTLEQRKLELEQDEYAKNVTTKSVVCGGCQKEISLDKRSEYYPGLWLKHKSKCPSIEKLERNKADVQPTPEGARQVSRDHAATPAFRSISYDDVQHQNHSAATTRRLVRYYDSEDLDVEEEEEDLPPQEPFPILNCAFYRTQRHETHESEWAYRYSTKDEITTNLFRGQNEYHARAGIRPFTRPAQQSYCVSFDE